MNADYTIDTCLRYLILIRMAKKLFRHTVSISDKSTGCSTDSGNFRSDGLLVEVLFI